VALNRHIFDCSGLKSAHNDNIMKKTKEEQEAEYNRLYQLLSSLSSKPNQEVSLQSILEGKAETPQNEVVIPHNEPVVPEPSLEPPKPKRIKRPTFKKEVPAWKDGSVLSFLFKGSPTVHPTHFEQRTGPKGLKARKAAKAKAKKEAKENKSEIPVQEETPKTTLQEDNKEKMAQGAGAKSPSAPPFGNRLPEMTDFERLIQTRHQIPQIDDSNIVQSNTLQIDIKASYSDVHTSDSNSIRSTSHTTLPIAEPSKGRYAHTRKNPKVNGTGAKRGRPPRPIQVLTIDIPPPTCDACIQTFSSEAAYHTHRESSILCQKWLNLESAERLPNMPIQLFVEDILMKTITGDNPHQCRFCKEQFESGAQHQMHFYQSRICNRFAHHEFSKRVI
jgi:hypothetical protein